jgi:nucleoid-associated protein YgaU
MGREVARVSLLSLLVAIGLFGHTAVADEAGPGSPLPINLNHAEPASVEVRRGDHLWSISKGRMETVLRAAVEDAEVAPYWRRVVEMNRPRLRSGDPDLIFPGETVLLPAVG